MEAMCSNLASNSADSKKRGEVSGGDAAGNKYLVTTGTHSISRLNSLSWLWPWPERVRMGLDKGGTKDRPWGLTGIAGTGSEASFPRSGGCCLLRLTRQWQNVIYPPPRPSDHTVPTDQFFPFSFIQNQFLPHEAPSLRTQRGQGRQSLKR